MKRIFTLGRVRNGILFVCLTLVVQPEARAEKLFTPEPAGARQRMLASPGPALRGVLQRAKATDVALARTNAAAVNGQSDNLEIDLPDERSISARKLRLEIKPNGIRVWHGQIADRKITPMHSSIEIAGDPLNQTTLVFHDGRVTGVVRDDGDAYEIRPIENGLHTITKIDPSRYPRRGDDKVRVTKGARAQPPVEVRSSTHSTIRVMAVITNDLKAEVIDVEGLVELAFALANEGNDLSQVPITFENAGIFDPDYTEHGDSDDILDLIWDVDDDVLGQPVDQYRKAHRADLVAIFTTVTDVCGLADLTSDITTAFSLVVYDCVWDSTFAHEIGHNMGMMHNRGETDDVPEYAFGYRHQTRPRWRTVMAGDCDQGCDSLIQWSNPRLTYNELPMGTYEHEDAWRRLNERRDIVANFYPPPDPGTTPEPVAKITGPASVEAGRPLALSARTSIGSGLTYVWTATGFTPSGATTISPSFTAPTTTGPHTISVTVTDSQGRSATTTHAVTVSPPPADTEAPSTPGNFRVTAVTDTSVTLAWEEATDNVGVTHYQIRNEGGWLVKTVNKSTLTYTVEDLLPGTEYKYTVSALDKALNVSAFSPMISATTTAAAK